MLPNLKPSFSKWRTFYQNQRDIDLLSTQRKKERVPGAFSTNCRVKVNICSKSALPLAPSSSVFLRPVPDCHMVCFCLFSSTWPNLPASPLEVLHWRHFLFCLFHFLKPPGKIFGYLLKHLKWMQLLAVFIF